MNNRRHRKLLVVTGMIGFTSGVGIADLWLGDAQDEEYWRDSRCQLDGPTMAHMQAAFLDNGMKASQDHERGRHLDIGRLNQTRQSLLPAQW